MTDAEWLEDMAQYCDSNGGEGDAERLRAIAIHINQLKRENVELKRNALGPNPTVAEIVQDFVKRNGYDRMYMDGFHYRAGYIQPDGSVGPEKEGK